MIFQASADSVLDLGETSQNRVSEFVAQLFIACRCAGNKDVSVNVFDGVLEYNNSQKQNGGGKALTFRGDSKDRARDAPLCRFERQTVLYSVASS